MFTERKLARQRNQIEALQERIKMLERDNQALRTSNETLKQINASGTDALEKLNAEHKAFMREHQERMAALDKIKSDYNYALHEVQVLRENFTNEAAALLKRLRKQVNS